MDSPAGMQALQSLLRPPGADNEEADSDSDSGGGGGSHYAKLNPADIAASSKQQQQQQQQQQDNESQPANPNSIWHPAEVGDGESAALDDRLDPRQQPEYTMHFRQAVAPEDMYLQCGNKTPATASCEQIVVTVQLPGTKSASELNVDVRRQFVDLRTPRYRLGLHLPNSVDPDSGSAKFDTEAQTLKLVLNNKREYDCFNF